MLITKRGRLYVATGMGYSATGRSHFEAMTNLLTTIFEMKELYMQFFSPQEADELLLPNYHY